MASSDEMCDTAVSGAAAECWEDLMDGKIRKRVIRPGSGEPPEVQQDVVCNVVIMLAAGQNESTSSPAVGVGEGNEEDVETRRGPPPAEGEVLQRWTEKRFRIGEGEAVPMLELCLRYMKQGEECEAYGTTNMAWGPSGLKAASSDERDVPPDVDVRMRIALISCIPSSSEPSWTEKVEQVSWRKANGNDHFKRRQFAKAARCYAAGIEIFGDEMDASEHGGNVADTATVTKAVADCSANLAAVFLEQGEFSRARDAATASLGLCPDNVKAHFRLAKAHLALNNYDECESALEKASSLDATDVAVKRLATELRRARQQYAKKSKDLGAKLFEVDWASQRPAPKTEDESSGADEHAEGRDDSNGQANEASQNSEATVVDSLLSPFMALCCRRRRSGSDGRSGTL